MNFSYVSCHQNSLVGLISEQYALKYHLEISFLRYRGVETLWKVELGSQKQISPFVQMKWFLCDVISLHRWWERREILSICRNHPVIYRCTHEAEVILIKSSDLFVMYFRISCHFRNYNKIYRAIDTTQLHLLSKWSESSVMWYLYITDEKGERFCLVAGVIQYLTEVFTKRNCC